LKTGFRLSMRSPSKGLRARRSRADVLPPA
jgi:hypothetical protein